MTDEKQQRAKRAPSGFTPRTGGLASEYAREQGWELNEEQRARTSMQKQNYDGGLFYDDRAEDFGDASANPYVSRLQVGHRSAK